MPCALPIRSEEHTSELQSHDNLVCRLLLEKKNAVRSEGGFGRPRGGRPSATPARPAGRAARPLRAGPARPRGALPGGGGYVFFFFNHPAPPEIYALPLRRPLRL